MKISGHKIQYNSFHFKHNPAFMNTYMKVQCRFDCSRLDFTFGRFQLDLINSISSVQAMHSNSGTALLSERQPSDFPYTNSDVASPRAPGFSLGLCILCRVRSHPKATTIQRVTNNIFTHWPRIYCIAPE